MKILSLTLSSFVYDGKITKQYILWYTYTYCTIINLLTTSVFNYNYLKSIPIKIYKVKTVNTLMYKN